MYVNGKYKIELETKTTGDLHYKKTLIINTTNE